MTLNIGNLQAAIEEAWARETSADSENWNEQNPAWGQCAVTALAIQDKLGGELLRTTVGQISHYFNRLPDGRELDLTRKQFGSGARLGEVAVRQREYVLSFPDTRRRYELLKQRLTNALNH